MQKPLFRGEGAASQFIIAVLVMLIALAIIAGWMIGDYGFPIWLAIMGWLPAVLVLGPIAEKFGIVPKF